MPDIAPLYRATTSGSRELLVEFDDILQEVADTGDIVTGLRRSARLARAARDARDPGMAVDELALFADDGSFAALVAIEAVSELRHETADDVLIDLLTHPAQIVRRHASWRLGRRIPTARALAPLLHQLTLGGIDTMHAHRTLRAWSPTESQAIATLSSTALSDANDPAERARIVDLVGVIGPLADDLIVRLATDANESTPVRIAALGALGERSEGRFDDILRRVATDDDELGAYAALALRDGSKPFSADTMSDRGLRIAQIVMVDGLDGQLSLGGRGDTGGVASLLVSLGEALARQPDVDHVLTIGRGTVTDALTGPVQSSDAPLSYAMIAAGDEARPAGTTTDAWEHLPTIERGIRHLIRAAGPTDILHLRMADVGTLAGAGVASEFGVPVAFSLAADPHNVLRSMQSRGELDIDTFVDLETSCHAWFRARLVEYMATNADRLALFPRSRPTELFDDIGVPSDVVGRRAATVAEGVDVDLIRRAEYDRSGLRASGCRGGVVDELVDRIAPERRGLPLLLSVGRLNPVKGMDRVVAAWATDPTLQKRCNLVIVGGDLDRPSQAEKGVLDAIDDAVPADDTRRSGLIMLGGQPRAAVAVLLVAAARGHLGHWCRGGVYVDGALKEEFGLALIEALAAGLVVVAPDAGGPSTYVDHGVTGILADPGAELTTAIHQAFDLVGRCGRARRARNMVEEQYSIETMARQLVELYEPEPALL